MKSEAEYKLVRALCTTFSLTQEQRTQCDLCFLFHFSEVRYTELVRQITLYNLDYFRWYVYERRVKRELIGKVRIPKMRSMRAAPEAVAEATVGVSIRQRHGVIYVLIAPIYGDFKSNTVTKVRWSLEQVLSNCFLGAVSSE